MNRIRGRLLLLFLVVATTAALMLPAGAAAGWTWDAAPAGWTWDAAATTPEGATAAADAGVPVADDR